MALRVLITGSRKWTSYATIRGALGLLVDEWGPDVVVIHGAARGADSLADRAAQELGVEVEDYPAQWREPGRGYNPAAGHIRNAVMVDSGADLCLAFPTPESRGTLGCMRLVEKASIPLRVFSQEKPVGEAIAEMRDWALPILESKASTW